MSPNARDLTATLQGNAVLLSYGIGIADGVTILSRRESEPDFSPIAEDEPSPVCDTRPKLDPLRPETRYYRAILRYSSNENRKLSNEVRLTLP